MSKIRKPTPPSSSSSSAAAARRISTVFLLLLLRAPGGLSVPSGGFSLNDDVRGGGGRGHDRDPDEQNMGNPGPGLEFCHVSYGEVFGEATGRTVEVSFVYEIESTDAGVIPLIADSADKKSRDSNDVAAAGEEEDDYDDDSSNVLRKLEVALGDEIVPVVFEGQCPSRRKRRLLLRDGTDFATIHRITRKKNVATELETAVAGLSTSPPDRALDAPCDIIKPSQGTHFCTKVEGIITFHLGEKENSGEEEVEVRALAQYLINTIMVSGALDAGRVDEAIVRVAYDHNGPYQPVDAPEPTLVTPVDAPEPTLVTPADAPEPTLATPVDAPEPTLVTPGDAPEPTLVKPLSLAADGEGGKGTPYIAVGASAAALIGAIMVIVGVRMRRKDREQQQLELGKEISVVGAAERGYGSGGRLSSASVSSLGDNSFDVSRDELGSTGLAAVGAASGVEAANEQAHGDYETKGGGGMTIPSRGVDQVQDNDLPAASAVSLREDLHTAIESADWAAIGRTAALLASEASDSASHISGASSNMQSKCTSPVSVAGSISSLDAARAAELDRLVEAGDFESVALAAARFEAESKSKSSKSAARFGFGKELV